MAHKLLKTTEIPISDIVIKCGFEYQTYFNRVYKTKYGETPTNTREKNSNYYDSNHVYYQQVTSLDAQ